MKPAIASALVFLAASLAAFGNTYNGTITQTVTGTNDPLYYVGQTFLGYYQYQSPSMDGTFYTNNIDPPLTPKPPGSIDSLAGSVYMPFFLSSIYVDYGGGYYLTYGPGGRLNSLGETVNEGTLVVSNGQVSDFFWSWEQGGFYAAITEGTFVAMSFYDAMPQNQVPITRGSVVFGDPVEVPDEPATGLLLGGVLVAGLVVIRRQAACRRGSLNQG
jgi:hypothetical protein